jgi:biofilm PGA synthesis N-glycosyltransferase PgaC
VIISFDYTQYINFGLISLFGFSVLVQLYFYLGIFLRFVTYKRAPHLVKHPISVIICARNEAENLQKNLPSVLEQKHENFEVIVVDDCSTDHTAEVLGEFLKKYKNLRVTNIIPDKKFTHGKKLAITVGIKAAINEWLVFIDSDCFAESDQWLNRLQESFTDKTEIVLAYGGYSISQSFLNKYIQYDTIIIAIQYFSFAICGFPYMGVGRNLAYRKSLFFKNKGFATHYNLLSGDDDLFVNETANKQNTAVEFHHQSYTRSEPKYSWKHWSDQKKRHYSTADRYKTKHIFLLGIEHFSRILFYSTLITLLSLQIYLPYVIVAGILRIAVQMIIIKLSMNRLNERKLLLWFAIFDLFSLFINFIIYLSTRFRSKKLKWK